MIDKKTRCSFEGHKGWIIGQNDNSPDIYLFMADEANERFHSGIYNRVVRKFAEKPDRLKRYRWIDESKIKIFPCKIDLSDLQGGDEFFSTRGWMEVARIDKDNAYPIVGTTGEIYTLDGKYHHTHEHPSAAHSPQELAEYYASLPKEESRPDLKIDDPIIAGVNENRRYFAGWAENGDLMAWKYGGTSWAWKYGGTSWTTDSVTQWSTWRLPTEEELKNG